MKNFKKVLALVLVVASLLSLATVASAAQPSDSYVDKDTIAADYVQAVDVLNYLKVMVGDNNSKFNAKNTITREEAAKVIAIFDNKSADISTLYTSANDFADVVGRWSESYVGYCFRAGIVVGPRPNMFEPTKNVTGTEFLKMVLVTLGFEAVKEGFVGDSWKTNVLSLAKQLELYDGIKEFNPAADLTREEAAQILFNALQCDLVEYGNRIVYNNSLTKKYNYVTVAGAQDTGVELATKFGIKVAKTGYIDSFGRPYTVWLDTDEDEIIAKYADPKATMKDFFTECDLLVALGVPKTDLTTKVKVTEVFVNGQKDNAEEYYQHDVNNTCDKNYEWKTAGQGTTVEFFYLGKDVNDVKCYRAVVVDTWLGNVDSVSAQKVNASGHTSSKAQYTVNVYTNDCFAAINNHYDSVEGNEYSVTTATAYEGMTKSNKDAAYAKGDKVLVQKSWMTAADQGNYKLVDTVGAKVLGKAESKYGELTGQTFAPYNKLSRKTQIDGTYVEDAKHFHLNLATAKDMDNNGTSYTFYFDQFGNVIGLTPDAAAAGTYVVVDKMAGFYNGTAAYAVKAKYVDFDAVMSEDVAVAKALASIDDNDYTAAQIYAAFKHGDLSSTYNFEDRGYYDDAKFTGHLRKMTVSDDKYTFANAAADLYENAKVNAKARTITANGETFAFTNETKFLVKEADGKYAAFTGYDIGSLTAGKAEVIVAAKDKADAGYAKYVYLYGGIARTTTSNIGFVPYPQNYRTEGEYYVYEVYYGADLCEVKCEEALNVEAGFYTFTYADVDGEIVAKAPNQPVAVTAKVNTTVTAVGGTVVTFASDKIADIAELPVYVWNQVTNEISACEDVAAWVVQNAKVTYLLDGTKLTALYVWYE